MSKENDKKKEKDTSWDIYRKHREEKKGRSPPTTAKKRPWEIPSEGDVATSPVDYEWLRKEHEIAHSWKIEAKKERSLLHRFKKLIKRLLPQKYF